MALIHFGNGVVGMSGSAAGNTFARNRAGNYMRARTVPVNPRSSRQSSARLILAMLAEFWHDAAMDETERGQWNAYAAVISWNNRFGDAMKLSGFNHFLRSNAAILTVGGTLVQSAPTELTLPQLDETVTISASESSQNMSVAFDNAKDWAGEVGGYMMVEMGTPQNPSRYFFNGPWRYAGKIAGAASPPSSPATVACPFAVAEDQKVWARVKIIRADGGVSNAFDVPPFSVAS